MKALNRNTRYLIGAKPQPLVTSWRIPEDEAQARDLEICKELGITCVVTRYDPTTGETVSVTLYDPHENKD